MNTKHTLRVSVVICVICITTNIIHDRIGIVIVHVVISPANMITTAHSAIPKTTAIVRIVCQRVAIVGVAYIQRVNVNIFLENNIMIAWSGSHSCNGCVGRPCYASDKHT